MAYDKKGFLLYADLISVVEKLTDEKAGELFKHILDYVNDNNPTTDDLLINVIFDPIKNQLKRDLAKWDDIKLKRSLSGKKGGLAKQANARIAKQNLANQAVSVNDNVNDNVNDIKKKILKEKYLDCVLLTNLEYQKLIDKFGKTIADEKIENLNDYIMSKGTKYKSHYHTILSWSRKDEPLKKVAT